MSTLNALPQSVRNFYAQHASEGLNDRYLFDFMTADGGQYRILQPTAALELNDFLSVHERLPGFFAVGDNAGDEVLLVQDDGRVVIIPILPMRAQDALVVAVSLEELFALGLRDANGKLL